MAEQVIRQKVDDLERERGHFVQADEQIVFGLDGVSYVIDLSTANAKELRKALEEYISVATPLMAHTEIKKLSPAQAKRAELDSVRRWSEAQGVRVSRRGRIPREIIEKYEQANGPLQHQDI